jgi:hypothetical protein
MIVLFLCTNYYHLLLNNIYSIYSMRKMGKSLKKHIRDYNNNEIFIFRFELIHLNDLLQFKYLIAYQVNVCFQEI